MPNLNTHSPERAALSLVGAVGETAAAGQDWRQVLALGLQSLFNVKMGALVDIDSAHATPNPRPRHVTEVGLTEGERAALWSYVHDPDAFDPFLSNILAGPRSNRVVTRRDVVADDNWYGIPLVEDYIRKAGLDDLLVGVFIPEGAKSGFMTVAHRALGERSFTSVEAETMRLIQHGLSGWSRLLIDRSAPPSMTPARDPLARFPMPRLSPRLRQLLEGFIAGKSERQVADEMGLSRHTVHMHAKRLYKAMEVKSRAELVAKAMRAR